MVLRTIRNATMTGTLRRILPALAAAALVGSLALPAHADDDDWQGRGRGWHHGWEKHHHHYYGPGYYYAPPVYYAPPPVVYAPPPPVVYAPPAVYAPPSVNFVFPLYVR